MEKLTKEDEKYLKDLKELLYKLNKGHVVLNVVKNTVDISAHLSK